MDRYATGRLAEALILGLALVAAVCAASAETDLSARAVMAPWTASARLVVSARPLAGDGVDLLFDVTETHDAWALHLDGRQLQLLTVKEGQQALVATAPLPLRRGTHSLTVKRHARGVRVLLDREQVFDWPLAAPGRRTQVGSRAFGDRLVLVGLRVQPLGPIEFRDDFARQPGERGPWQPLRGEWDIAAQSLPDFSANPFCFGGRGRSALVLCGHDAWEGYRLRAALCLREAEDAGGLVVCAEEAGARLVLLRLQADGAALVRLQDGQETILAKHAGGIRFGDWYELTLATRRGRIAAWLDTTTVFDLAVPGFEQGRAGLWADSVAGVLFDDVCVEICTVPAPVPLADRRPSVGETFAADVHMQAWSALRPLADRPAVDDAFQQAPVGWRVDGGAWGVQSRWQCQPRWTWFGGRGARQVAVWHKARFGGDVSATAFLAFCMDSPFDPNYRHLGDVCLSLCADGRSLFSGYTFAFAADRNRVSRLYRQGRVVAESRERLLPDNRDAFPYREVHLPWLALCLNRIGRRVSAELDGEPLLAFDDPEPLYGPHVAVWTWDNAILIARARIEADRVESPALPEPDPAALPRGAFRISPLVASVQGGVPVADLAGKDLARRSRLRLRYRLEPGAVCNLYLTVRGRIHLVPFSGGHVRDDDIPLAATFDPRPLADGRWHSTEADLAPIAAAYRGCPTLPIERAWFGLESDDPYSLCSAVAAAPEAVVEIRDLRLEPPTRDRRREPSQPPEPDTAQDGSAETFEHGLGSVKAGEGGRGPELTVDPWERAAGRQCLRVRNPVLGGTCEVVLRDQPFSVARWPKLDFDYRIPDGLRVDLVLRVGHHWRTIKFTDTDETWPVLGRVAGVVADRRWHHADVDLAALLGQADLEGWPICELRLASGGYPGNEEGLVFRLDNLALSAAPASAARLADRTPPTVRNVTPADGGNAEGAMVTVALDDAESGVDWASLRLTVADRTFHVGDPCLRCDPHAGTVAWDALRAVAGGMVLGPDREVSCELSASDLAGNPLASPFRWTWQARAEHDRTPPAAPPLVYVPSQPFCRQTFEQPGHAWGDWGGFDVRRTDDVAASGDWALRLTRLGHVDGCQALWDVRRLPVKEYPLVGFSLWVPARADAPTRSHRFELAELCFDGHRDVVRTVAGLGDDAPGAWRFVVLDLRRGRDPAAGDPYGLLLRHCGEAARPVGLTVLLDNVTAFSPVDREPGFEWSAPADVSGIAGYSWVFDQCAETLPDTVVTTRETSLRLSSIPAGAWVFHLRAVDGAGNWGPAAHLAIRTE